MAKSDDDESGLVWIPIGELKRDIRLGARLMMNELIEIYCV